MNTKKRIGFLSGLFKTYVQQKKKNVLFEIDDDL